MKIGVPKEIKNNENRVGLTPAGVKELVQHGHDLFVQHTAGDGSGFADDEYVLAGATILPTIEDVYADREGKRAYCAGISSGEKRAGSLHIFSFCK